MTMNDIIKDFIEKEPELYLQMMNSDHHYLEGSVIHPNKYHLEGDVWSHTMMVCANADRLNLSDDLKYAALLHDIGKVLSRTVDGEKKRTYFIGHEGVSAYLCLRYLNTLGLSEERKLNIFKLVALHGILYKLQYSPSWEKKMIEKFKRSKSFLKELLLLIYCDHMGRFSEKIRYSSLESFLAKYENVLNSIDDSVVDRANRREVKILCGPPMAGKSSYCSKLENHIVVSRDQVIEDLNPDLTYDQSFRKEFADEFKTVNSLFEQKKKEGMKSKLDLVIDLVNAAPKRRRGLSNNFNKSNFKKIVVLATPYDVLLERNKKRSENGKTISEDLLISKLKTFVFPLDDESDEVEVIFGGENEK